MPEQKKPFVVTDRRKFTMDGEPRPDADPSPEKVRPIVPPPPDEALYGSSAKVVPQSSAAGRATPTPDPDPQHQGDDSLEAPASPNGDPNDLDDPNAPPAPTPEQLHQSKVAFDATAERLETAIRAANPGMEHPPAMSFERLVQSVYMTAIMQLGGGTPDGQKPQVDLMGSKQSIDMLNVIAEKSAANLSSAEQSLIESALFELRLAFLDVTQALARSAAAKQPASGFGGSGVGGPSGPGSAGFGPSIVR